MNGKINELCFERGKAEDKAQKIPASKSNLEIYIKAK